MDKMTKKLISENVQMKSLLNWFFDYIEKDNLLTNYNNENTFSFPNVVISLSEKELLKMKKIIGYIKT